MVFGDHMQNNLGHRDSQSGLTLIDVSILLIVLSLLLFPALRLIDLYNKKQEITVHFGIVKDLSQALNDYALRNGEYPLPADPSLPISNANVFKPIPTTSVPPAADCDSLTSMGRTYANAASMDGVLCRRQHAGNATVAEQVLVGALPVTALGFPTKAGLDQYGRKFTYIVTKLMTNNDYMNTLSNNNTGSVVIVDQSNTPRFSKAHFAIITHGLNGAGGYGPSGATVANDTCGTNLDEYNRHACRYGSTHHAGFVKAYLATMIAEKQAMSTGNAAQYFDDAIAYKDSLWGKIWTPRNVAEEYFTLGRYVGVSFVDTDPTFTEAPPEELTLKTGNIHAAGNLETQRTCNENFSIAVPSGSTRTAVIPSPTGCFQPDDIANPYTTLYCSDTAPLKTVRQVTSGGSPSSAGKTCDSYVNNTRTMTSCPNGYKSISSAGVPVCI